MNFRFGVAAVLLLVLLTFVATEAGRPGKGAKHHKQPKCSKPGEEWKCGKCDPSCDNRKPYTPEKQKCKNGCFCWHGYVRDCRGYCIPPGLCPKYCPYKPEQA